jgi:hypothetical protein
VSMKILNTPGPSPVATAFTVHCSTEGDEVSPWVSHVSWHMMMFSFLLIRQRPCMHL